MQRTSINDIICECFDINRLYINGYPEITDCSRLHPNDIYLMTSSYSVITPLYIKYYDGVGQLLEYLVQRKIPVVIEVTYDTISSADVLEGFEFSGVNIIFDSLESFHEVSIEKVFEREKHLIRKLAEMREKKYFISLSFPIISSKNDNESIVKILSIYKNYITSVFIGNVENCDSFVFKYMKSNKIPNHEFLLTDNKFVTGNHVFDYKPMIINNFLTKSRKQAKRLNKYNNVLGVCNKCGKTPYVTIIEKDQ